ncbi:hypothetical protein [Nonomuraea turcica]|uniref:hypothetical protein n=1 Tax=Nonomuraea sp. G32 TaxID=3067274 RepID=UPI00273B62BA|nr:hypothetical protein [Nonomuraea sp. G32]MDP4501062.1 hypothetical protein [Nonomuraea sp. G32]
MVGDLGPVPGRLASNLQSVDVVVTPPAAATACPQTYTVQAYLTPLRQSIGNVAEVSLLGTRTNANWVNTGLALVLPDPGEYLITGDIRTNICATVDDLGATNLWTTVRLLHVQSGAVELGGNRIGAQHQFSSAPGTQFQTCQSGTAPLTGLVRVTAAQATKTVRVQAKLNGGGPNFGLTGGSTIQTSIFDGANSQLTYVKIAD